MAGSAFTEQLNVYEEYAVLTSSSFTICESEEKITGAGTGAGVGAGVGVGAETGADAGTADAVAADDEPAPGFAGRDG
jgi:hypothetical protein